MIELQRASAGSGKTYTLARKFIWYYITVNDGAGRRLRTAPELSDSLGHILAVTFTNKATNEMQQRIVEKLYGLAYPTPGKTPDYMADFMADLAAAGNDVTEKEISETCRRAVGILLNNYSDFHVSTIDSFFQQVLRTFAYESDLRDSYRIELDTDFLSRMAIDSLLEEINSGRDTTGASFWINEMMDRAKGEGQKWNVFAKSDSGSNPYALLTESVKRLENEEFKDIRRTLDDYFNSGVDFQGVYNELKKKYEEPVREAYRHLLKEAEEVGRIFRLLENRLNPTDYGNFEKHLKTVRSSRMYAVPRDYKKEEILSLERKESKTYESRKKKGDTAAYLEMEEADTRLAGAYSLWIAALRSENFRHWTVYNENLPFLGMLQAIRDRRDDYLRENNAIELGETNAMLHDIIGEEDAPFIYERIGSRLNHFLIDEFQDTSNMQWRNLSPLLHESVGRGNENLIIGDAKQSIYRFRNADSSLISSKVPEEFGFSGGGPASAPSQNTNWRSALRVVQFNNSFFRFLVTMLNTLVGSEAEQGRRDFEGDYRNVVQHPHHKSELGYVEVRNAQFPDDKEPWREKTLRGVVEIISDALDRGFRMRDIAVLVDRRGEGEEVIETIMRHNSSPLTDDSRPYHRIEYVSEQSLRLTSSAAVALVVSVLETISRGAEPEIRRGEERARKGVADWADVACNFRFFAMRHPDLSTPECLDRFFAEGADNDAIAGMLRGMQAVTLPALVESIIADFVPESDRRIDAVFLAAFQDLVLEYCESRPSDVASFLEWWDDQKKTASIASPEGMDAVTVMTVHKSKGLEFPLVIIPFSDSKFSDSPKHPEWRWVRPAVISCEAGELPPYLPVGTTPQLEGTAHEGILYDFYDHKKMDALNSAYVAFTRAKNELYIFSSPPPKKADGTEMSSLLGDFLKTVMEMASGVPVEGVAPSAMVVLDNVGFAYGEKYCPYIPGAEAGGMDERVMEDYPVRPTPDVLLYRIEELPDVVDADDPELSDDPDPRSEGNLMHEIMQEVVRQEDIPRAVRRMVIKGLLDKSRASMMAAELTAKTGLPEVRSWYDGSMQVLTERPLLTAGKRVKRPDRIMVSDDGHAVVVDYKFGESVSSAGRYARQVHDYVETLKDTGRFRSVTGYLWYVRLGKLELVCR
ncbi:MAG: UvrD-helicase domain-containing protein [Muribaculaceae bacterium]|nr:UvrD-helicase domain-containing protein [Muribaculaceae bacterium]